MIFSLIMTYLLLSQVDVLETQFQQLVDKIQATRDFEAIRLAHDSFLTSIQAQCFLLLKPVCSIVLMLFYNPSHIPQLLNSAFGSG